MWVCVVLTHVANEGSGEETVVRSEETGGSPREGFDCFGGSHLDEAGSILVGPDDIELAVTIALNITHILWLDTAAVLDNEGERLKVVE